ncbi:hypothetical protein BH24ACT26_BH24ACT26_12470 [soil metagenome]
MAYGHVMAVDPDLHGLCPIGAPSGRGPNGGAPQ